MGQSIGGHVADITATINLESFLALLQQGLASAGASLRNTLRSVEEGTFNDRARRSNSDAVVQFSMDVQPPAVTAAYLDACNKCFLDQVRALVAYVDQLLSGEKCVNELRLPLKDFSGPEELKAAFDRHLEAAYQDVSRNSHLTNPRKLEMLGDMPSFAKEASLSYFEVRRCIEHHSCVPQREIVLCYIQLTPVVNGIAVERLPVEVPAGGIVTLRTDQLTKSFRANERMALSEADIERATLTIHGLIAPSMLNAVRTKRRPPG
jgi:hypothetical protein